MVSIKQKFIYLEDGEIDLDAWLQKVRTTYHLEKTDIIEKAAHLAKDISKGLTTFYGQPCIEQGLEMAEIILNLKLDQDAVAAAIMVSSVKNTKITTETLQEKLSAQVNKLIQGVSQMEAMRNLQKSTDAERDATQIDRLRKLLLAMVSDIRVVLIKLAERTTIMRGIKGINPQERKHIAQETMDIYAPLANRLGVGQLKWELEDISFHYYDPDSYKKIAKFLAERRVDRETRIHAIMDSLRQHIADAHIKAEISGRAKHIYSIYLKTVRKDLDYKDIYDSSAVRILVPTVEDCYAALSIAHSLWKHIPEEFDDYIATPKPNGYKSIHTAVVGPDGRNLEIQIRTFEMHEEAERGVAAHWMYKENKASHAGYETKVAILRQLLDWHRDVAAQEDNINPDFEQILSDRVYVFTPTGEILELADGATPLDCAYLIHSEIGNHCRGAKINGHIVPLTYKLRMGDKIEILTNPKGTPSRDWLNSEFGYLATPRAKAKVAHWFRQQDLNQHIEQGRRTWERDFAKLGSHTNLQKMAARFNLKDEETFLAALGRGNIRPVQITHMLETEHEPNKPAFSVVSKKMVTKSAGMSIAGINDLLTRIARCCKPIPGDDIIGFITQGSGVSIHKKTCKNISHLDPKDSGRLMQITWDSKNAGYYYVDLLVRAHNRENLLKEITTLLISTKVSVVNLNSTVNRDNMLVIMLTVQINALTQLTELLTQIHHLQGVIDAKRLSEG